MPGFFICDNFMTYVRIKIIKPETFRLKAFCNL